jgi:hypothetical protein
MNKTVAGLVVLLALCALSRPAAADDAADAKASSVAWLSGCWQGGSGGRIVDEQWMTPRGGMMLGMGRTTAGDKTIEFEQVAIREQDGHLVYEASPSGQLPASFSSIKVTTSRVVFENLEHDFPQRIIYSLAADGSLQARIEGLRDGQLRGIDYPMKRVACPDGKAR